MEEMEKQFLIVVKKYPEISVPLLMLKMKINKTMAEKLYAIFLRKQAKDWFYMRNFGVNSEGFLKGDFSCDNHTNVV